MLTESFIACNATDLPFQQGLNITNSHYWQSICRNEN